MIKVRVQGLPAEVEKYIDDFREQYEVLDVSTQYENKNSEYVRVYLELEEL